MNLRSMATTLCVALLLVWAVGALAEVPHIVSYQGRLTDADGTPVADGDYNITFQIFEHYPVPMGESPLWTSGVQAVSVTDGLFTYYLGSNVPLPPSVFTDDGLDSHYLRLLLEDEPLASIGVQLVTSPFAFRSLSADTAMYAHSGPGSGATGWVDDGSVVHTETSSDNVGIGTSNPTDRLVVGGNLGSSIDDTYIVARNNHETYSGYRLGFNSDNFGWMRWNGLGEELRFGTRTLGTNYLNTMVLRRGNVGIGLLEPLEPLVVGKNLGSYSGDRIVVGDDTPGEYAGVMVGEHEDRRGWMLWDVDENALAFGLEDSPSQWNNMIRLQNGEVSIGVGSGNSSVQLPNNAVSSSEMLNEPGIARTAKSSATTLPSETWVTVCQRTCDFPSAGYAIAIVCCDFSSFACYYDLEVGIARNGTVAPRTYSRYFLQSDYDDVRCHPWQELLSFHEVFNVDSGSNTFNFMAISHVDDNSDEIQDVSLAVVFIPSVYAAKDSSVSVESPGEMLPSESRASDGLLSVMPPSRAAITNTDGHASTMAKLERLEAENVELRRRLEALERAIGR